MKLHFIDKWDGEGVVNREEGAFSLLSKRGLIGEGKLGRGWTTNMRGLYI